MSTYPQETSILAPGCRLDRYELLFAIGMGGMATVWVARLLGKHGFEKLVAVKTILPHIARDVRFQEMFLDEARIASRIHHANVAQILDLGDQQGVLFLAMEWIEGDALSKLSQAARQRDNDFPARIAIKIVADVCAGLHAAHELCDRNGAPLGIVHRDVSPPNILISEQGVVKIIDFGIAKARDRVGGETETGSFKGKVKYMAPEQALSPRTTDRRADLWAAGAILYHLLSGRPPYEGDNDFATLTQLASGKPPSPLPNSVPEPVRAVVMRALAWEPDERYATAAEFQAALENAMTGEATATSADVAAFCAEHLAVRTEARKKAVALALSAAEERARVSILLAPSREQKSTSFGSRFGSVSESEVRGSPIAAEPLARLSETSHTALDAATTLTAHPATPGAVPMRRHLRIAAALTSFAAIAAVVVVGARVHRAGNAASAMVRPAALSETVTTPTPVVPSVVVARAAAEMPAASTASVAAKSAPPTPAAVRRRPPVTQPSSQSNPSPDDSPPAPGLTKHRAQYGF